MNGFKREVSVELKSIDGLMVHWPLSKRASSLNIVNAKHMSSFSFQTIYSTT